ncbi:hypothetical protein T484DRAFT_1577267, partial [Baffinella frigidus]
AAALGHDSVVRLLLVHGAELSPLTCAGETPLTAAAGKGHQEVARLLIQHGAEVSLAGPEF